MESNDELDMSMEVEGSRCAFLDQPSVATIDIDKRGDLILLVGKHKCKVKANGKHKHTEAMAFRVCSRSLARSSPVMEAMLFGNFREATQTEVNLPEDNPKAMQMLLYVVHGNTDPLFQSIDARSKDSVSSDFVEEVYEVAALANKYLMTQHLRPFVGHWCQRLMDWNRWDPWGGTINKDRAIYKLCEKSMWVANEFGHVPLYEATFGILVRSADHIRLGQMLELKGRMLPFRNAINALENNYDPTGLYLCKQRDKTSRISCQTHSLESLIKGLRKESLWPLPDASDVAETIHNFIKRLEKVWRAYQPNHADCNIKKTMRALYDKAEITSRNDISTPPKPILLAMVPRAQMFGFLRGVDVDDFSYYEDSELELFWDD